MNKKKTVGIIVVIGIVLGTIFTFLCNSTNTWTNTDWNEMTNSLSFEE